MTLLIAHLLTLAFFTYIAVHRLYRDVIDCLLGSVVVAWANIVITALLLSTLHRLGDPVAFFRLSIALATLLALGILGFVPRKRAAISLGDNSPSRNYLVPLLFVLSLLPLLVANLLIARVYGPSNYDSLTYHLPRVMFYLGQGTLAHFATENARQVFFPFNFSLLHLAVLQHGVGLAKLLTFLQVGFWAIAGCAIYRCCRLAGSSVNAALAAVWVGLTATQVLAQSTATINDLPTAGALLIGVVFAQRWQKTRAREDALFCALAVGLALGTKLTPIFLLPAAAILLALFTYRQVRTRQFGHLRDIARSWTIPASAAFAIAAPFAIYNVAATGHWMTTQFDYTLNRPFSFASFWQTSKTFTIQFFVEPFQRFHYDASVTADLNRTFRELLFARWNPEYAFSDLYIFPPDLNEDHVWFGFAGGVVLTVAVLCIRGILHQPTVFRVLATIGLGWFVAYWALNKWSLYNQRYFTLPFLLLVPCLAWYIDAKRPFSRLSRAFYAIVFVLVGSSYWFAIDYVLNNTARPLLPLLTTGPRPSSYSLVPAPMADALRQHPRISMWLAGGNERPFPLMQASQAHTFVSTLGERADAYNVISKWSFVRDVVYHNITAKESHVLIPVPRKRTAGVVALGSWGEGTEEFDYFGLAPSPRDPPTGFGEANVLASLQYARKGPNRFRPSRFRLIGLSPTDGLEATVSARYTGKEAIDLARVRDSNEVSVDIPDVPDSLLVSLRDVRTADLVATHSIPFRTKLSPKAAAVVDPLAVFGFDLITSSPTGDIDVSGLGELEGPYVQWNLPQFRWSKQQVVRISIPPKPGVSSLRVQLAVRLQVRDHAVLEILHNGTNVRTLRLFGREAWTEETITVPANPGGDTIELRDTLSDARPDWRAYVSRNGDVTTWAQDRGLEPEAGAPLHYSQVGRPEGRLLTFLEATGANNLPPDSLYFVYQTLRVDGRKVAVSHD